MSSFKKNLKDNVINPYNKYNLVQERRGEVLKYNKNDNTCTVSYKNIDGINVIEDLPLKNNLNGKGLFSKSPKKGQFVEIQISSRTARITGIVKDSDSEEEVKNNDTHSSKVDFAGMLGV